MASGQEIGMDEFVKIVGQGTFYKNNDYIFKYFTSTDETYSKLAVDLKVLHNGGSSYSVYETEKGNLLTTVQLGIDGKFYVMPIGVAKILAQDVLGKFNLIDRHEEFSVSAYKTLFYHCELPDNERIDQFLYYIGIILLDTLNLDIYNSVVDVPDPGNIFIDGVKNEFVWVEGEELTEEISYENVSYVIGVSNNDKNIDCCKIYDSRKPDRFKIPIDDLITKAYNELKTDKK